MDYLALYIAGFVAAWFWLMPVVSGKELVCIEAKAKGYQLEQCEGEK